MSEIIKKLAKWEVKIPSESFDFLVYHLDRVTDEKMQATMAANYAIPGLFKQYLSKLGAHRALSFEEPELLQLEAEALILVMNNNGRKPITMRKMQQSMLYYTEYYFTEKFAHKKPEYNRAMFSIGVAENDFFEKTAASLVSKQDNNPDLRELDQEKLLTWLFNNELNGFSFFTFLEAAHLVIRDLDKISGIMTKLETMEVLSKTSGGAGNYIIRFTPLGFISVDGNKDEVQKSNMDDFIVQSQPIFNQRLSKQTLGEILHEVGFSSFKTLYSKDGKKIGSTEELFPAKKGSSTSTTSSKSVLTFKAAFDPIAWRI